MSPHPTEKGNPISQIELFVTVLIEVVSLCALFVYGLRRAPRNRVQQVRVASRRDKRNSRTR